jgi:hypothetical protein
LALALAACHAAADGEPDQGAGGTGGSPTDAAVAAVAAVDGPSGPKMCAPTGGGPYWVEEGQAVIFQISCSTGRQLAGADFMLGALPAGATYDATTATVKWTPGLDQAAVYLITATARPFGETGEVKVGVADRFDDPKNVKVADPAKLTEEFGLPVFHITADLDGPSYKTVFNDYATRGSSKSQGCIVPCTTDPSYAQGTVVYRGKTYQAEAHYRGATSLKLPKKSITIRFDKNQPFGEPVMAEGRIRQRRHITLTQTFDDNSYTRWGLAFEVWNRTSPMTVQIAHYPAVVYLNGAYWGLYQVSDKIDTDLFKANGLDPNGNVYMAITHAGNFFSQMRDDDNNPRAKLCPWEGFAQKNGSPGECDGTTFVPQAYDDIVKFSSWVALTPDTQFNADVASQLDVRDYVSWFITVTLIDDNDSFEKNGCHYHDADASTPWRAILWDHNASLGQYYNTARSAPTRSLMSVASNTPQSSFNANNLFRRLWNHPVHGPTMRARYSSLLKSELKVDTIVALLDAMAKEVDASAKRDERKWQSQYRMYYAASRGTPPDWTTNAEEVPYVRDWIKKRWANVQGQLPP